ncbi:MAG: fibrinogen-like YCDxxxxGGGW domain-containing protein [Candidatus Diapherotrites archaeon]|nr:fibrinogen-like YCDxxxxGGGW domain-containing protein [Candidatus Diapherotrites archaeon]
MNQKAQAGLEYLMTYGWALILVATIITVLVFVVGGGTPGVVFTVSDPTKILLKSSGISGDKATIILQNATGGKIDITGITPTGYSDCTINAISTLPIQVVAGGQMTVECTMAGGGPGTISMQYNDFAGFSRTVGITGSGPAAAVGTESNLGLSCKDILDKGGSTGNGIYWIDPDGSGPIAKFQVYCDMTTDDGGWILAAVCRPEDNPSYPTHLGTVLQSKCYTTGQVGTVLDPASPATVKLSDSIIRAILGNNGVTRAYWSQTYRLNISNPTILTLYNKFTNISPWSSSGCGSAGKEFFKKTSYGGPWSGAMSSTGTGCSCAVNGWSNNQIDSCGLATWIAGCEKAPSMSHSCAAILYDERADVILWLRGAS